MFLAALLAHPIHFSIDVLLLTHDATPARGNGLAKRINLVIPESSIAGQRAGIADLIGLGDSGRA